MSVKKLIVSFILFKYLILCRVKFWIYGPYGVSDVLKIVPFPFIQKILVTYGAQIGRNCVIDTGIMIHRPDNKVPFKNLIIDDNCYIGHNTLFDLSAEVHLEHDVGIGAFCQFWTHVGEYKDVLIDRENDYHETIAKILVRNRTVIYSGSIISPGVTIGECTRIGAGSVVTEDVAAQIFCAGVPAKKIKELSR